MRWRPTQPGDERIVKKFLLIPTTINGETRWLETAKIRQVYDSHFLRRVFWADMEWIDEPKYLAICSIKFKYCDPNIDFNSFADAMIEVNDNVYVSCDGYLVGNVSWYEGTLSDKDIKKLRKAMEEYPVEIIDD